MRSFESKEESFFGIVFTYWDITNKIISKVVLMKDDVMKHSMLIEFVKKVFW